MNTFDEGVKPGGLTTGIEIRILLCYLLNNIKGPASRALLEEALLGEELVNYFVLAEAFGQLAAQGLVQEDDNALMLTSAGRNVAMTLAQDVPRSVRDTAVRSVIRAQQHAAKQAAHHTKIVQTQNGLKVMCSLGDGAGALFEMALYMPDELTAKEVQDKFIERGDAVYKLVLAALTQDERLARQALAEIG